MTMRDPRIQTLIDALDRALSARLAPDDADGKVARGIFAALRQPLPAVRKPEFVALPAPEMLATALEIPRATKGDMALVADAFAPLAADINWWSRMSDDDDATFTDSHAFIVGPGGLEDRDDAEIGCSLLAPNVRYPDHHHPPPEVYLSLTPGIWRKGDGSWVDPGIGGTVFNAPNDVHAMKSHDVPLFAFWCLLLK